MKQYQLQMETSCPHSGTCGGCTAAGVPYEKQLADKQRDIQKLLGAYGNILPIQGMSSPLYYRNKVVRSFASDHRDIAGGAKPQKSQKSTMVCGIYAKDSRRVTPVDTCLVEDAAADAILSDVYRLALELHIPPYDVRSKKGVLRHALVRVGKQSGEYLLVLVTGTPVFPGRAQLVSALKEAHPEITSIVQNINGVHTGMVLGDSERVLYGTGYIKDILCGLTFRFSPRSFYQVNHDGCELLYETAMSFAGLTGKETVLDAYCGIGTIGLIAAKHAKHVIGVELNADAVSDAIANAKENHITNCRFYTGDAGSFLRAGNRRDLDTVFMDPPRTGSDPTFLSALCHAAPKKVVYISCGPESLARDLQYLTRFYRVEKIQPVDMFPMTGHVETVCLLSKLNAK